MSPTNPAILVFPHGWLRFHTVIFHLTNWAGAAQLLREGDQAAVALAQGCMIPVSLLCTAVFALRTCAGHGGAATTLADRLGLAKSPHLRAVLVWNALLLCGGIALTALALGGEQDAPRLLWPT